MGDFASQLRQHAREFKDSEAITELLDECMRRLESVANSGKYSVPWSRIKQQAWKMNRETEEMVLKRLSDEGIEVVKHTVPQSPDPREHDWIELQW